MDIERLQKLAGIEVLNEQSSLTLGDAERFINRKGDEGRIISVPPKVVKDMKAQAEKELTKVLKAKNPAETEKVFRKVQYFVSAAKVLEQAEVDTFIIAIIFQRGNQAKVKLPKSFDTLRLKVVTQNKAREAEEGKGIFLKK